MKSIFLITLFSIISIQILYADTLLVPDNYESIQAAIEAADNSDVILVAEGRYEENIEFSGRTIRVIGNSEDPTTTVIDGGGNDSVVKFNSNERDQVVLEGFTIQNGYEERNGGGGIYLENSSPSLRNLIITQCFGVRGGGVLCRDASPHLTNVTIVENESQAYGGGVYMLGGASPILDDCTIIRNVSTGNTGGGIACYSAARPEVNSTVIRHNSAEGRGGGIYSQGTIFLQDVLVDSNASNHAGGGIYANGNIRLTDVRILANTSVDEGGGLYTDSERPTFDHVLIADNSSESFGGGMCLADDCAPQMQHITITNNTSGEGGGAIYCRNNADPVMLCSILWGNVPQEVYFSGAEASNSITLTYCDVEGGEDNVVTNNNGDVSWGNGSITEDPLLADPDAGDYHLSWENYPEDDETKSPCIDAGHPDLDEDPDGTQNDMGYYYFHQAIPEIDVFPRQLVFDDTFIGDSDDMAISIANHGEARLNGALFLVDADSAYVIRRQNMEFGVASQETILVVVSFMPTERGVSRGTVQIESDDPASPRINVGLFGECINAAPEGPGRIDNITVNEDTDWTFIGDLFEIFVDPEGDDILVIEPAAQFVQFDVRNLSMLYLRPVNDFAGVENLTVTCRDNPYGDTASVRFDLSVNQINDLPDVFDLRFPENQVTLLFEMQSFFWRDAVQNRWEVDSVLYDLHFHYEQSGLSFDINNIEHPEYRDLDMNTLLDSLDINLDDNQGMVEWWVTANDDSGSTECREHWFFTISSEDVTEAVGAIPHEYFVRQNYPNPFNAITTLRYGLPVPGNVSISVFDSRGRMTDNLLDSRRNAGEFTQIWDASGHRAGTYFIRLQSGEFSAVKRIVLVK